LQSLVERAATQEDFRVIRQTALMQFQANLVDSLGRMRKEQARSRTQMADMEARLKKTEELLTQAEASYQEISTQRDSMTFLGIPISKSVYQSLVGVLLAVLAVVAGYFYFRFRSRNGVTSRVEKLLLETQEEFDQYKKRAIEREQKLKRELQDELNKRS
jgi:preprotein translocase subunit SecF